jgi:5-methyltetrahydropteroyltriglutamate--homocysteine methyltransferase
MVNKQVYEPKMETIGCYITGILPRPEELIEVTRAYDRARISREELENAFEKATKEVMRTQITAGLSYITDGMLKWQDLLRPFTEKLEGVHVGSLARWFNNNTFYRKPIITNRITCEKNILEEITYRKLIPKDVLWKVILPAPYTFIQLAENQAYSNKTDLMFEYAKILNKELSKLVNLGVKYIQLSDPALVYQPISKSMSRDELSMVKAALDTTFKGISVKTCLQTFFGDFTQILPEALEFSVDHLGVDIYETHMEKLVKYSFDKGIALGIIDARNSLMENMDELVKFAKKIVKTIYFSDFEEIFVCPNCDLEYLPWKRAKEKIKTLRVLATRLEEELHG